MSDLTRRDRDLPVTDAPHHQTTNPPAFPTETEIYILPDGRVVVADLPGELNELIARVGSSLEDESTEESRNES